MVEDSVDRASRLGAVDQALRGLNGAATRLSPLDKSNHLVPLTEFCWWAISADEALEKALTTAYRARRDADADGRMAAGLRYVRNALGHHQLTATRVEGGLRFPIVFPVTIEPVSIRWVSADELVTGRPDRRARAPYEQHLAGQLVEETTYAARRWLERASAWAHTGVLPA